jgi:hypothetical protein
MAAFCFASICGGIGKHKEKHNYKAHSELKVVRFSLLIAGGVIVAACLFLLIF